MYKTSGRDAKYYILEYGPQDGNGVVSKWTEKVITQGVQYGTLLTGLTPGTTYQFRVRAQGKFGMTEWSAPYTKMCT